MEGPLVEINLPSMDAEWNGAIAFLDRDGVLNIGSPEYINSKEELVILEGAVDAIQSLRTAGYRIAITTNQSAVMRGKWGPEVLTEVHSALQNELGVIDVILSCPHRYRDRCRCRKPHPGMLNDASDIIRGISHTSLDWWGEKPKPIHPLDLMVGDRNSDMGAGWAVGARLFKVNENLGLASVIDRILEGDEGDTFEPVG